ncbi:MAG: oligosaccharide flippase family protein, partial [Lachnospiraceae bacterium]|nr:oligosaccharide flippase family protein [Lachnospiraceae bacterium]
MIKKGIEKYKSLSQEVKASFWFLVCGFLQRGISLITTPIFSRVLSTAEYGDFSVFNTWTNVISIFATLNLASGGYTRGLIKY